MQTLWLMKFHIESKTFAKLQNAALPNESGVISMPIDNFISDELKMNFRQLLFQIQGHTVQSMFFPFLRLSWTPHPEVSQYSAGNR